MQYQPGDSIGVMPHNDAQLVEGLLQHLQQDGDQVFSIASSSDDGAKLLQHLGWPCTLRHALTRGCDLTSIPRSATDHAYIGAVQCLYAIAARCRQSQPSCFRQACADHHMLLHSPVTVNCPCAAALDWGVTLAPPGQLCPWLKC